MKKFFLAMLVAAATMINFSSCKSSSSDDDKEYEIQVADLLNNSYACDKDDNGEAFEYWVAFTNDGTNNIFSTSDGEAGTFTVSGSTITLTFVSPDDVAVWSISLNFLKNCCSPAFREPNSSNLRFAAGIQPFYDEYLRLARTASLASALVKDHQLA